MRSGVHTTLLLCSLLAANSCGIVAAQVATQPAAGFQGIWYEITGGSGDYPNKYGGGLATYPQQTGPLAIYSPQVNRTYFAFSYDLDPGTGRNIGHAVSYFDHQTGLVARPQVWIDKNSSDAHDSPTLLLDDAGYLYLFSNTHGEARQSSIRRSAARHSISATVDLLSASSQEDMDVFGNPASDPGLSGNPRFSYSTAWHVPNTTEEEKLLLLHTRYISGQRDLFTTSSVDGDVWTPRKTLAQIESGQYQMSWIKPDGASVGTIFNVHPTGQGLDWRTDLYYFETSDQAKTWRTVDGLTLVDNSGPTSNPLTSRPDGPGDGAALAYDAAPGERVYLKDLNYDAAGNPVIMFLTSPSHIPGDHGAPGPDRFIKTAHWNGSQWDVKDVTTTDHNYDFGSLYVEGDGTWRIIAPYIDGPQTFGTGGEIGVWTSNDLGSTWTLQGQLTAGSNYNHTYVRRPLNAHDDFYAVWADGDAWDPSSVHLYFSNKQGDVFHLPFEVDADFVAPEPYVTRPSESPPSVSVNLADPAVSGSIASVTYTDGPLMRQVAPGDVIGGRLVDFQGTSDGASGWIADVIVPPGASPPAPSLRADLLRDGLADTGFANLSGWSVAFDEDVRNAPGPDIILLDWGGADRVDIAIGGVTLQNVSPTSADVAQASMSGRRRYQSNEHDVATLAALESATFAQPLSTSGNATAYAIDLTDFGFAPGASLAEGELVAFVNGQGIDPMEVFAFRYEALPGDFNLDGAVDAADYTVWRDRLNAGFSAHDFSVWAAHFGMASVPSALHAVPEPGSLTLVSMGLVVGVVRCAIRIAAAGSAPQPLIDQPQGPCDADGI